MTAPRVLVVYYSRTGNTEAVASGLARAADADLEAIREAAPRRGVLGYLRAAFEATYAKQSAIREPNHDPSAYDLVLIGSPTWNAALPSPVRRYLVLEAPRLPQVGFFVTCGGRGAERVARQMAQVAGKEPLSTLTLTERDLKGRYAVYLAEYLEQLRDAWQRLYDAGGASRASLGAAP